MLTLEQWLTVGSAIIGTLIAYWTGRSMGRKAERWKQRESGIIAEMEEASAREAQSASSEAYGDEPLPKLEGAKPRVHPYRTAPKMPPPTKLPPPAVPPTLEDQILSKLEALPLEAWQPDNGRFRYKDYYLTAQGNEFERSEYVYLYYLDERITDEGNRAVALFKQLRNRAAAKAAAKVRDKKEQVLRGALASLDEHE